MEQFIDAASPDAEENPPETEDANHAAKPVDPLIAMSEVDPEGAAGLRTDWGDDFDRNIALARRAATVFVDPALRAVLDENGLGDDPRIVRAAAEIGRMMQQRSPGRLDDPPPGDGNLQAKLTELVDRADYWSPAIQREVRQIYLKLYGDRSLPTHHEAGDAGRDAW